MNCRICGYDLNSEITIFNFFTNQIMCNECNKKIERSKAAIFKYNKPIKKLIKIFKFYGDIEIASYIAKNIKDFIPSGYVISFPPSSKSATEKRGFIPMELVAKKLGKKYINLFEKEYDYQQSLLAPKDRKASIKVVAKPPTKVVLIDDVITTGKTVNKCKELLEDQDVKVKIIVFSGNFK